MPTTPKGSISAAISSAVVQLMREYTGRGPTKARTYIDEDLITVVLQDTLTMGERSLVRDGEADLVLTSRKAFQRTMSTQMIAAIERHSGRSVYAFLSDNHIDPDIAVETFVLAPLADGEGNDEGNDVSEG
ncbi:MAG TPA: DUF2294 domain-containing protein [Solirubrobacteraceae bacterium]|jgi:uncharacterized protein YbcI|nr:DUF2294 domain-containing protein [Solirubrobacteraceae bacterium]